MDEIDEILTRGVEKIYPSREALEKILRSGKKIKLYLGIDPTSPKLHLGHTIPLKKLQEFQDLGHEVIFLIGGFTGQIGDPSGRDKKRKPLTPAQVKQNFATYKKQAAKILDFQEVKQKDNSTWWNKTSMGEFLKLASMVTHQQLIERSMFQNRIKTGEEVWFNELIYPLLQGYDSVVMNVDLEVGGNDQTFNMLIGRKLQKIYNKKEKFVMTVPMVVGLDGRKMSKTYGNTVDLEDPPNEMFGKLMSLKDELITEYFEIFTPIPFVLIQKYKKLIKTQPMEMKKKLAWEIVKMYHGKKEADNAQEEFEKVFQKGQLPEEVRTLKLKEGSWDIIDLLMKTELIKSKSEAKRLIAQKAVEIDQSPITDHQSPITIKDGMIIRVGKKRFIKIKKI